jgi:CarD family transcriptional regulator|tara:strand:+ start:505 stop:1281 length:777 start_codon:yes stop_codon:yes gene_type:complete
MSKKTKAKPKAKKTTKKTTKKTPSKKVTKKAVKKSNKKAATKVVSEKKIKTKVKEEKKENLAPQNFQTRTSAQNDLIEIKKIKKQETEKRVYKVKDYVIYPKHGIGQIISVDKLTIAGIDVSVYKIEITKDKLNLTIPTNQQNHLRPLSSLNQINKALSILKGKAKIKRTMWSRRAAEYEQKINSGDIYQIAEVVRDLNKNTDMPIDQSYSERQLFEKAYDRLLGEVSIVLKISVDEGKVRLNKSLGKKIEEPANQSA